MEHLGFAFILIGVAIATTGVFMLPGSFSSRAEPRSGSRLQTGLMAASLLLGGITLSVSSWFWLTIRDAHDLNVEFSLPDAPAAGNVEADTFIGILPEHLSSALIYVHSLPVLSQHGEVKQDYSYHIAQLLVERLVRASQPEFTSETEQIDQQSASRLRLVGISRLDWCDQSAKPLVVALDVNASGADPRSALRQTHYELRDCTNGFSVIHQGEVVERLGDQFPFERSLKHEIDSVIELFARSYQTPADKRQPSLIQ